MQATFHFDLGSPFAYLAAERLTERLGEDVLWQPVSLGAIFKLTGRSSWGLGDPAERQAGMAEVERRAHAYGLPPLRWPQPWPGNYLFAMRAATYAARQGLAREFALRAFRDAFQRGSDLALPENVLASAAQIGLDERAVERAVAEDAIKLALREATDAALARGVPGVPTVVIGGEVFWGDDRLPEAAARLRHGRTRQAR